MRLSPHAVAVGLLLGGCKPGVDLDAAAEGNGIPPGQGTTDPGQDGTLGPAPATDDGDEARLDLAAAFDIGVPPPPLPPGMCPPDCQFELSQAWAFDGPVGNGRPVPSLAQIAVVLRDDQRTVIAEQREGAIALTQLDANGQSLWTMPLALPCDPCRLGGITLDESDDLILAGHGFGLEPQPGTVAVLARIELSAPSITWAVASSLVDGDGITARAGSVATVDGGLLAQTVVEASMTAGMEDVLLHVHDVSDGELVFSHPVDTVTPPASPTGPPIGSYNGVAVLAYPGPDAALAGRVAWVDPLDGSTLLTSPKADPVAGLAMSGIRAIGTGRGSPAGTPTLTVHATSVPGANDWSTGERLGLDFGEPNALVTDALGHVHVATQLTPASSNTVQLWRWSEEGSLLWQVPLPLATDEASDAVALDVGDDDGLVLAAWQLGQLHVERRVPTCECG